MNTRDESKSKRVWHVTFQGERYTMSEIAIRKDNQCAFSALETTRAAFVEKLLPLSSNKKARIKLSREIRSTMQTKEYKPKKAEHYANQLYDASSARDVLVKKINNELGFEYQERKSCEQLIQYFNTQLSLPELSSSTKAVYRGYRQGLEAVSRPYQRVDQMWNDFCAEEKTYNDYISNHIGHNKNTWIGCDAMLLYAELTGISLYIWREEHNKIGLFAKHKTEITGQVFHVLHTKETYGHFNRLKAEKIELTSSNEQEEGTSEIAPIYWFQAQTIKAVKTGNLIWLNVFLGESTALELQLQKLFEDAYPLPWLYPLSQQLLSLLQDYRMALRKSDLLNKKTQKELTVKALEDLSNAFGASYSKFLEKVEALFSKQSGLVTQASSPSQMHSINRVYGHLKKLLAKYSHHHHFVTYDSEAMRVILIRFEALQYLNKQLTTQIQSLRDNLTLYQQKWNQYNEQIQRAKTQHDRHLNVAKESLPMLKQQGYLSEFYCKLLEKNISDFQISVNLRDTQENSLLYLAVKKGQFLEAKVLMYSTKPDFDTIKPVKNSVYLYRIKDVKKKGSLGYRIYNRRSRYEGTVKESALFDALGIESMDKLELEEQQYVLSKAQQHAIVTRIRQFQLNARQDIVSLLLGLGASPFQLNKKNHSAFSVKSPEGLTLLDYLVCKQDLSLLAQWAVFTNNTKLLDILTSSTSAESEHALLRDEEHQPSGQLIRAKFDWLTTWAAQYLVPSGGWFPIFGSQADSLKALAARSIEVNHCDKRGTPLLHLAIQWGQWESAVLLIEKGASLELMGPEQKTALELQDSPEGKSLLSYVLESGRYQLALHLLRQGGYFLSLGQWGGLTQYNYIKNCLNFKNKRGNTLLHWVLETMHRSMMQSGAHRYPLTHYTSFFSDIELLLQKGADILVKNNEGASPLEMMFALPDYLSVRVPIARNLKSFKNTLISKDGTLIVKDYVTKFLLEFVLNHVKAGNVDGKNPLGSSFEQAVLKQIEEHLNKLDKAENYSWAYRIFRGMRQSTFEEQRKYIEALKKQLMTCYLKREDLKLHDWLVIQSYLMKEKTDYLNCALFKELHHKENGLLKLCQQARDVSEFSFGVREAYLADEKFKEQQERIKRKDQELNKAKQESKKKDQVIEKKDQKIEKKDQEIEKKDQEIEKKDEIILEQQKKLKELEKLLRQKKGEAPFFSKKKNRERNMKDVRPPSPYSLARKKS